MLFIVLRKILNNKGLIAALLVGSILAVAMVSSIPMYTNAILQRMLVKDFAAYQEDEGVYAGRYTYEANVLSFATRDKRMSTYKYFAKQVPAHVAELGIPSSETVLAVESRNIIMTPKVQREDNPMQRQVNIVSVKGWHDHVKVKAGRLPTSKIVDGAMEVAVQEATLQAYDMTLGETYKVEFGLRGESHEPFYVTIVGIYDVADNNDLWWYKSPSEMKNYMFMNWDIYMSEIAEKERLMGLATWYYALDYSKMDISKLEHYAETFEANKRWTQSFEALSQSFNAIDIINEYGPRAKTLTTTLWVLQAPILIMLAFYIFMVSQMVVANDANEIAVFKSRGAKGGQVFWLYILQSLLLAGVAFIVGPFASFGICSMLGSSNGFLEFVGRTSLPLKITLEVVLYSAGASLFTVVMMMFPAMSSAKKSIVEHKQKKARQWDAPLWQKMFLDVICLAVSIYGLYSYSLKMKADQTGTAVANTAATLFGKAAEDTSATTAAVANGTIDPLLFLISTLFILGCGLLFLRLYPYIIRFVFWLGRKIWNPVLYTSFITVGRSSGRENYVMLFLILTLAVGVFSANSARTINQNIEDRINYTIGCDTVMELKWSMSSGTYKEPDMELIKSVKGVDEAAKVFIRSGVKARNEERQEAPVTLVGIQPSEFGKVVWTGGDYLNHHIYEYLNLMSTSKDACIVPSIVKDYGYDVGDEINFYWGGQEQVTCTIYAFADLWPAMVPDDESPFGNLFIIADLDYLQSMTAMEPYQIWIKRDGTTSTADFYQDIADKKIALLSTKEISDTFKALKRNPSLKIPSGSCIVDAGQQIVIQKNDALLQGTNGSLTLSFLVTMAIAMIGFLIYWVLSIKARELQFGILRAMGMTQKNVIAILICEQVMISLVAVLIGVFIGSLTSQLYIPLLSLVYSAGGQVPDFRVVASPADYGKIYAVIAFMLVAGFAVLGTLVNRIHIAQALKLGED